MARALEVVGERWTLLIIREALHGVRRYDDFLTNLGIPTTTLARRLDHLVSMGALRREQYANRPPRFEYRLTSAGRDLALVMAALRQWGDQHRSPTGPPVTYQHKDCGGTVAVSLTCAGCQEPLRPKQIERQEHRPVRRTKGRA